MKQKVFSFIKSTELVKKSILVSAFLSIIFGLFVFAGASFVFAQGISIPLSDGGTLFVPVSKNACIKQVDDCHKRLGFKSCLADESLKTQAEVEQCLDANKKIEQQCDQELISCVNAETATPESTISPDVLIKKNAFSCPEAGTGIYYTRNPNNKEEWLIGSCVPLVCPANAYRNSIDGSCWCNDGYEPDSHKTFFENCKPKDKIVEPAVSVPAATDKEKETEKEIQCSGAYQEYDPDLKECACVGGYWQRPDGACRQSVTYRLSLDVDSAEEVENLVDTLETNGRRLVELTLQNGETLRLGVIKLGNGQIIFTKDGENFYQNLGHTIQPSFMRRTFRGIGNFISRLNPLRWVHTRLKDDYPGQDKEEKWQIAKNVLKDLEKSLEKEKELAEYLNDIREKLASHKDNLEEIEAILRAGGESDDVIRVLADMGLDEIKGFLKDKLISFPAETIKELHNQLNTDDFAEGVRIYIAERANYSPEQIFDNSPPELEFSGSVAREHDLGKRLLHVKYEEAYQRYLLSQDFNK